MILHYFIYSTNILSLIHICHIEQYGKSINKTVPSFQESHTKFEKTTNACVSCTNKTCCDGQQRESPGTELGEEKRPGITKGIRADRFEHVIVTDAHGEVREAKAEEMWDSGHFVRLASRVGNL